MSALILVILAAISVPVLISYLKRRYRIRKLINKIPGPKGQPIIGSACEFLSYPREKRLQQFAAHFETYGYIFRSWIGSQPIVTIANAEDVEVVLSSRTNIEKSMGYKFLEPWIGTGLLTSNGKKWTERRKLLTPAFHFSILNTFFRPIVENCNGLIEKLKSVEDSEEIDIYPYINNCTLDIICETAMGVKLSSHEGASEFIQSIRNMCEIVLKRAFSPWFWWDFTFSFSKYSKRQQEATDSIHKFTLEVINARKLERQNNPKTEEEETGISEYQKNKAFLDLLLDICEKDNVKMSDADIREEVDTFMFEGSDTVASALSWAIYLIGSHSDIQEKISEELYSVFGTSQRNPTMSDIAKLKYLESVIKESLRLYPSVVAIWRKLSEDILLSGKYEIPADTIIEMSIYQLHRNPKYYPNPEKFDPENFSTEASSKRHPFAYVPFSAGPRNCIGQKFAMLEVKVLLSSLLRRYKIESLQKFDEIIRIAELVLVPGTGIKIRITRRVA